MREGESAKALKAGVWYTFSNFLSKGLVFITTSIFARLLTKNEFGDYSNFATWQNLLLIVATLELYSTIPRAKYDYSEEIDQYISTITLLGTLISLAIYALVVVFMPFVSELLGIEPKYIHVMFLYILVAPALQIYQAKCRVYLKYISATIITVISSIVSILLAVLLVFLLEDKLFARIIGQQSVLIAVNVFMYGYILYKGRSFNRKYFPYALKLAVPLIPHIIAGNLLGSFDKIAIKKICGSEDLAYYSLAFSCALLANVLWSSLNQAMVPWLFERLSENNRDEIKRVSRYYIGVFMVIAVGILFLVPEIVLIFGGRGYEGARSVMAPIVMGCCFQFAYSMYVNIEMFEKKTLLISMGTGGAALLNIPLNFIFIKLYGYSAAAYTTMFCYAALAVFHYFIVRKLGKSDVYDNKFNAIVLIIMQIITILVSLTYSNNLLRWSFFIVYLLLLTVVAVKEREKIKKLYLTMRGRR